MTTTAGPRSAPSSPPAPDGPAPHGPAGTATVGREARLRRHLVGRAPTDLLWGWVGPLVVGAVAGVLRFWRLDQPHQLVFDETYYVKQAYTLLQSGYEKRWPEDADAQFTAGNADIFLAETDRAVHPPVGKWMIAFGEWLFGIDSSWGWRFSAALVGTLMVVVLARTARRLFGSTLLGVTAGLLLAVDGHHLVHSRTSLLDIFMAFWVLCGFAALVVDRDRSRRRLARVVADADGSGGSSRTGSFGPWLGARPFRLVAVVCLALACGVKWSGVYFLAAFLVMSVLWDAGARRAVGVRHWFVAAMLRDGLPAALVSVPTAVAVYTATWVGWFRADDSYLRQWGAENPSGSAVPDALRSLWHYHADMYEFHRGLSSPHTYQASPWSWTVQGRPTSFFYESVEGGSCAVDACSKAITSLGNPVVWWGGTVAMAVLVVCWIGRRDWRAGAILAGIGAGWLPWFVFSERTIFGFYAVAFAPFVVLALTYVLGLVLGPRTATPDRRLVGGLCAGAVVVLAVVLTAYFWPILTAEVIPYAQWRQRMWFPSWI